jgi:hypothetical protein
MKLLVSVLVFLLFAFTSESDTEKISWSETKPLTWNDFQGVPQGGNDFVASTNSGMSFSFSYSIDNGVLEFDYSIESHFYPKQSWFKRDRVSDYILKHEQTHFDISELHARIFRQRMETATFSENIKTEVNALYRKTENQRKEMQSRYDKESNHSKNKTAEFAWRDFVAKQLKAYESWK